MGRMHLATSLPRPRWRRRRLARPCRLPPSVVFVALLCRARDLGCLLEDLQAVRVDEVRRRRVVAVGRAGEGGEGEEAPADRTESLSRRCPCESQRVPGRLLCPDHDCERVVVFEREAELLGVGAALEALERAEQRPPPRPCLCRRRQAGQRRGGVRPTSATAGGSSRPSPRSLPPRRRLIMLIIA